MGNAGGVVALLAAFTRWAYGKRGRPLRGVTRLSNGLCDRVSYQGEITLSNGVRYRVDTDVLAERAIAFRGDYHPEVTAFLKQHIQAGAYCLDIGANVGFYTLLMAHLSGANGRVAAFEPNPAMAARIRPNLALNHFAHAEVIEQPVHNSVETLTFYIHPHPGKSSLLAEHVPEPEKALTVQTVTLDGFIAAQGWQRLDVIKIDTEGNDCRAILGGAEVLKRLRPHIIFEYWVNTPPEIAAPTFEMLQKAGYRVQLLHGEPFDWRTLSSRKKHVDVVCLPE